MTDNAGELLRIPRQSVLVTWMVFTLRGSLISNHWLRIRHAAMKLFDVSPSVFVDRPF